MFKDKILLIISGTGSFRNRVASSFLNQDVAEIRIFLVGTKRNKKICGSFENYKVRFYIGDVRDYQSVVDASRGVNYIFHAAALKQVPSMSFIQ